MNIEQINNETCKNHDLRNVINFMKNVFQHYRTQHKAMQRLKSLHYVEPELKHVATVLERKRIKKRVKVTQIKLFVIMIPLNIVIKNFLELPNVFTSILEYIKKSEDCSCICSIFQGERWKQLKTKYGDKIVLPLTLYGDDFEINNPLGSHRNRNKLHALYCNITAIPPEYSSLLENIFVFQLFRSEYKKKISLTKLFNPVIE